MTRHALRNSDEGHGWLTLYLTLSKRRASHDRTLELWSLLDERQRRCVARFVHFMEADAILRCDDHDSWEWEAAYDSYWRDVENQPHGG